MVCDEVVVAVVGAPRAVAAAGTAVRVEVAAAEEAAAAVADLLVADGDATEGAI